VKSIGFGAFWKSRVAAARYTRPITNQTPPTVFCHSVQVPPDRSAESAPDEWKHDIGENPARPSPAQQHAVAIFRDFLPGATRCLPRAMNQDSISNRQSQRLSGFRKQIMAESAEVPEFCFCSYKDGAVGIGVLPKRKELLVLGSSLCSIARKRIGACQTHMRQN
jgi:hypothetical protein